MRRRLLWILLALALALGAACVPAASADGGDNAAVAVNTKDGAAIFKFAFAIRRVMGDVVDGTNAAVAYASCTDCKTTAIAIEILLVDDPSVFTPTNMALAINEDCSGCETFAAAYQFVVQSDGPVRFSQDGRKAIQDIGRAIRDLGTQNLAPADLDAELAKLMGQLKVVLDNEVVPVGSEGDNQARAPPEEGEKTEPAATTGATTTAPATTTTATTAATTTTATTTTATTTAATTTTATTTEATTTTATTTTTDATTTPTP